MSSPFRSTNHQGVAKCLAFHDGDFTFPDDLAPLLDLLDPADSSSSTTTTAALISAAPDPDDAITASADSALTEVVDFEMLTLWVLVWVYGIGCFFFNFDLIPNHFRFIFVSLFVQFASILNPLLVSN